MPDRRTAKRCTWQLLLTVGAVGAALIVYGEHQLFGTGSSFDVGMHPWA